MCHKLKGGLKLKVKPHRVSWLTEMGDTGKGLHANYRIHFSADFQSEKAPSLTSTALESLRVNASVGMGWASGPLRH